jgi:hypothetical protein
MNNETQQTPATETGQGNDMVEVCVIVSSRPTQTLAVERGTTVAQLAATLGVENAQAINGMGQVRQGDHQITDEDDHLSFITQLQGA